MSNIHHPSDHDQRTSAGRCADHGDSSPGDSQRLEQLAGEFIAQFRRGENPQVAQFAERHPELAVQIRELFPALLMMERVRPLPQDFSGAMQGVPFGEQHQLDRLGDFRILREVGRGGMGIVYEAEQMTLGRHVALKVLPKHAMLDPCQLRRFQNEARAAARLHHTNIVPVFDVGEHEGLHYYVMQFIHGLALDEVLAELRAIRKLGVNTTVGPYDATLSHRTNQLSAVTLAERLLSGASGPSPSVSFADPPGEKLTEQASDAADPSRGAVGPDSKPAGAKFRRAPAANGRRSETSSNPDLFSEHRDRAYWKSVARMGSQVADALQYAHEQGILHRDIKPANLLLDLHGIVWVTDFGLARGNETEGITRTGDIVGTIRYMAPEQFEGKADARSDIYGLGVTLYELLTLRTPFDAEDRAALMRQIMNSNPRRPRSIDSRIPMDLETVVLKTLNHSPAQRYQQAADLAADLRRFLEDRPIQARRVTAGERAVRWCRRNPMVTAFAAIALILGAGLLVSSGISWAIRTERDMAISNQKRAEKAESQSNSMRRRAEAAEREATVLAHLSKADAAIRKRKEGQRTLALREISMAAKLNPTPAEMDSLRNAAIAALVLPELSIHKTRKFSPRAQLAVDRQFERYAVIDPFESREITLHQMDDDRILTRLPIPELNIWWVVGEFTPDGRYLMVTYCLRNQVSDRLNVWDLEEKNLVVDQPVGNPENVVSSPVAVHPGGRFLVIPREDRNLSVWDLVERRAIRQIEAGVVPQDVKFSPDGSRLAICGEDLKTPLRVLDFESGESVVAGVLPPGGGEIAISPSGRLIAFGGSGTTQSGSILVWDLDDHRLVSILEGHTGLITSLRFVGRDDFVVSSSWDGTSKVWNLRSGECLLTTWGYALAVAPDKGQIALQPGDELVVGELTLGAGQDFFSVPNSGNRSAAEPLTYTHIFNDSGELVIAGSEDGVHIWDTASGMLMGTLPIGPTRYLLMRRSGDALITFGTVGIVRWPIQRSVQSGRIQWKIGPPGRIGATEVVDNACAAWLPGERQIAINERATDQIRVLDADPNDALNFSEFALTSEHRRINGIAVSPNGQWLAVGGWKEVAIQVWNLETRAKTMRLPHSDGQGDTVFHVQFSPDNLCLVCGASNVDAPGLYFYETGTWKRLQSVPGDLGINPAFSQDGRLLCWQSVEAGQLVLADPQSRAELARLTYPAGNSVAVPVFSSDGRSLLYRKDRNSVGIIHLSQLQASLNDLGLPWNISIPPSLNESRNTHAMAVDCGSIPDEFQTSVRMQEGLELSQQAWEDAQRGDFQSADDKYGRAIALAPDHAPTLNNFAWLLVACPDESLRDAKRALTLAQRADSLQPNSPIHLNTLGVAEYRSNLWRSAMETLQRAEQRDPGAYFAFNGFFIAMAHQQLGERDEAKSWYERSVEWMNQGHGDDKELIQFREEARTLLGLPPADKGPPPQSGQEDAGRK